MSRGSWVVAAHPRRYADTITLHATGNLACPVTTLRALRGSGSRFVLDGEGSDTTDPQRIGGYLTPLPRPAKGGYRRRERLDPDALAVLVGRLLATGPQAARDLALITISHGAALRGHEAITIAQGDIRFHGPTLKITVPDRREPIYLPGLRASRACPVSAWRVGQAQLTGDYVYTSLRVGAMRGWIRDGRRELLVARDAGLLSLSAVERHERRETLISHSVAGMVGL